MWSHALGPCSGATDGLHCGSRKRNGAPEEEERDEEQLEEEEREEEEGEVPGRRSPELKDQREASGTSESSSPAQQ